MSSNNIMPAIEELVEVYEIPELAAVELKQAMEGTPSVEEVTDLRVYGEEAEEALYDIGRELGTDVLRLIAC